MALALLRHMETSSLSFKMATVLLRVKQHVRTRVHAPACGPWAHRPKFFPDLSVPGSVLSP